MNKSLVKITHKKENVTSENVGEHMYVNRVYLHTGHVCTCVNARKKN